MVFPYCFNLSLSLTIRNSWSELQSAPGLFCWLYRAYPSLAAKNIINLISVLTIWWCPSVESFMCCWKRVFARTNAFSWQNSVSLRLASFCTPRPNLLVVPGISWLLTFAFQSPIMTEKAMAPHSSTLAWKIPWTEEPGRLQSMGLLRVGHDWVRSLSLFTFMHWRRKWQPTPVFLPGESQGWGSLVGCRLWGRTESDTTEAT